MKSEIKVEEKVDAPITFPCLMEIDMNLPNNSGYFIVMMVSYGKGVTVYSTHKSRPVGEYYENWMMRSFKKFEGEVTLKND